MQFRRGQTSGERPSAFAGCLRRLGFSFWSIAALFALVCSKGSVSAQVIDKQKALNAQTWWDNKDWDWYKANIPFFECPDADIVTTWYYRWELITKHLTYGSPNSGYSFTEFIDRPFWSGAYGSISCPAGHQLYEIRWLRDPQYARDYAKYWFRTPGAQPRNYGCWIADGVWAEHQVHPDASFMKDLLPDLKRNYEGWEKRQFVPEVGLFWQNGHDDGMEFNINSRQTKDILRGANGYRPGFNAYMYADALAIAHTAQLAGDKETARIYRTKAASLKEKVQKLLWDPKRDFFFPMSMRDESDNEGNLVKKNTLTYQSGKFAGNPHGREEHGYIPWQFNLPDPGFESAWKFLMDKEYFYSDFGPTTVERNDPMFVLKTSCCWWSGQSWPYATAQTLKALSNLLHNYRQNVVTRADYLKLLHNFAASHRKNGVPYLAEALNPDTGSFEGHDGYNHSEHYFHSSFNDLVITGLVGLNPRADDTMEIEPLAPADWNWFALDEAPYHGHKLSILWDRDGTRYGRGAGLRVLADGKVVASRKTLGKLTFKLLALRPTARALSPRLNYAVNNDGDYYPRITASFTDPKTSLDKINDGNCWYSIDPPNRWTSFGSPNSADSIEVDFGIPRTIDTVRLGFLDDGKDVVAPQRYDVEFYNGGAWQPIPDQKRTPVEPTGRRINSVQFAPRDVQRLRVVFTHGKGGFTGLSEIEAWGDGTLPYSPAPPKPGNLAFNPRQTGYPKASASFHDVYGGLPERAIDGKVNFKPNPVNRWTSYGSPNKTDWCEVDFGLPREVGRAELYIYDDHGGVQPPESYSIQYFANGEWRDAANQLKSPPSPAGSAVNTVKFSHVTTSRIRVLFTHKGGSRSGLSEIEFWTN
ncbi:MAG: glycosyl hydrolase family 65 protein [Chthonomonadales bacterium]